MQTTFRLFQRQKTKIWFAQHRLTGKQKSLRTTDYHEATRLLHAMNEAHCQSLSNLRIAEIYAAASDPEFGKRTWSYVWEKLIATKSGSTAERWKRAVQDKALLPLRDLPLLQTRPEHFLNVLQNGTVSTNKHLRNIQNFALNMSWLNQPILAKRIFPKLDYKKKRAITAHEHARIVAREHNPETRAFYRLLWEIGASQTDAANLNAEDVDWQKLTITFRRKKLAGRGKPPLIKFDEGDALYCLLKELPQAGPLFPRLRTIPAKHRAVQFKKRCVGKYGKFGLQITGVSLHSYRYSLVQRMKREGYPQRFAQMMVGHNSKAIHELYGADAEMEIPSLGQWKAKLNNNVVPVQFQADKHPNERTQAAINS